MSFDVIKEIAYTIMVIVGTSILFFAKDSGKKDEQNKQLKKQNDEVVESLGIDDRIKRDPKYRGMLDKRFDR